MTHFTESYCDELNDILHRVFGGALFFKQEIVVVDGLVTGVLITYDNVRDDVREIVDPMSRDDFLARMSRIKPDWQTFDLKLLERLEHRVMMGYEGRTIYFIKSGKNPDQWTITHANKDTTKLVMGSLSMWGGLIRFEVENLRSRIPTGHANFRQFEDQVRVIFNFLFRGDLGEGKAQSRTESKNEGIEIRDIVFANNADSGFWKDLKDKYSATEIVVDAKNTETLTRDDLRQLYCYLKPALGFWGIIVCRQPPPRAIEAFNRTLYQNFAQQRGVLILSDDDLRRMVEIANRGDCPSSYMRERMSEFIRGV
jgi:hypothetical protein